MSVPRFHGKPLTSSRILGALADDLSKVKAEDKMTWVEVGEVLGVSDDQAAKYADGSSTMNVVAYTRGRLAWNGRFTGTLDKLVDNAAATIDGQHSQTLILKAALSLSAALEDGSLTDDEIRVNRATLEDAKAAIEKLLCRIGPKVAA